MKTQLDHRDAVRALRNLGFVPEPTRATSHEEWSTIIAGRRYRVTLDKHLAPYSRKLLGYIARQAGVSVPELFEAVNKKGHPRG